MTPKGKEERVEETDYSPECSDIYCHCHDVRLYKEDVIKK